MSNFVLLFSLFFVINSYAQNKFVPNSPTATVAAPAPGQTPLPPDTATAAAAPAAPAQPQVPQQQIPQPNQLPAPTGNVQNLDPANPTAVPGVAPGAPVNAAAVPPPAPTNPMMTDPLLEGFFEDMQYNPADKRDPFLPYFAIQKQKLTLEQSTPLEPLQQFALSDLKVIGIIWDVGHPKALVIDPGGKSHIIVENTKLGKEFGYVAAIREGEIIVVEPLQDVEGKKGYQTKILKLTKQ